MLCHHLCVVFCFVLFCFRKCQLTVQVVLSDGDDPGYCNVHGRVAVHKDSGDRTVLFDDGCVHH